MVLTSWLAAVMLAGAATCAPPATHSPHYLVPDAWADISYYHELKLDAYAPPGEPRPAAVIIHGSRGNKTTHITQLFDVLGRAGYAWFSLDYHSVVDVAQALSFIRCPGRFNITRDIVLIGEDAGSAIALSLAARGGIDGVVAFGAKLGAGTSTADTGAQSGVKVPVLVFHGTADEESPPASVEAFCAKLPKCTFVPVPGAIHNFENWHPDQWAWKEDLIAWLRHDRRGLWKDIAYSRPGGRDLSMDAFVPQGPGPFPAVIIAHGGGWEAGDKVTYVSPVFEPLAKAGFAWFSIDYRLTPYVHVPDELEDIRAAIRYVREHSGRFHVDPNRIALLGESASGHLVSQIASSSCPGCNVQAVVSFYGVYDFTAWVEGSDWQRSTVRRLFGDPTADLVRAYSPLQNARMDLPPTLLIQGTRDELSEGTMRYARRLKEVGAPYELVLLEGAPHGMENWEGHPEWTFYKHRLIDWLKATLRVGARSVGYQSRGGTE